MYVQITVNQLLFTWEKFSREPGHRKYFSPRIGPCPIILIITLVLIRLCRENLSSWTSSSRINHEIKLLRIKVGVQYLLLYQHYSCCSRKLLVKKKFFFLFRCIKRSFFFFFKTLMYAWFKLFHVNFSYAFQFWKNAYLIQCIMKNAYTLKFQTVNIFVHIFNAPGLYSHG